MSLEQMPSLGQEKKENNNPKELDKKALELEKMNRMTENASDPEIKEAMIEKMDEVNEAITELEEVSGLSSEEILKNYTELNQKLEEGGDVNKLIKNLAEELPEEEKNNFLEAVKQGANDVIINIFKNTQPKRVAVATALVLVLSTGMAGNMNTAYAGENYNNQQQIERVEKIKNPAQAWEYLLKSKKGEFFKALDKIKNDLGYGRKKGFTEVLHYLKVAKEMGVSEYTKSLGLNYYQLDEERKQKAEQSFDDMLKKKGIATYFESAKEILNDKESKENNLLEEIKKMEEELKTPQIKQFEEYLKKNSNEGKIYNMGLSAHRSRYIEEIQKGKLTPEEAVKAIIKIETKSAQEHFENK